MPRDEFEIVENWNTTGMRGTGSHDGRVGGVFVSDRGGVAFHPITESRFGSYSDALARLGLVWLRITSMGVVGKGQEVDLGGGFVVQEVPIPAHVVGKTLRDLAIRERTGVQVLLLRTGEGPGAGDVRVPAGDEALHPGETMVVAGSREALERLQWL